MCGIAGILVAGTAGPTDTAQVAAMLAELRHRGPDGTGLEVKGRAVLGHARLAIIDLVTGDQPQSDEQGRCWVVCNGEIYNYKELRAELEAKGHVFRTHSDIEVIPHLYAEMGDRCVERLRGMFAFALHDLERDRTLLARDRLGKKPLYWARTAAGGLAFASEARSLTVIGGVDLTPDPQSVDLFLTWQYVPAPWSIHRGIRKLPAATVMTVERDGRQTTHRYWDPLPAVDDALTAHDVEERIDTTLREACRLRLRSDVPLSTFLSGGIDSGLVASYLSEEAETRLGAVTVGFPDSPEDERPLTRLTASSLGMDLREELFEDDLLSTVEAVMAHMDEPHGDASCVPMWIVSRAASREVKVVISGDGGDEAFGGYSVRYGQNLAIQRLRRWIPSLVRRGVAGPLSRLWPKGDRLPRSLRLKNVLENLSREFEDAYALDMSIFRPEMKKALYAREFAEQLGGFDARGLLRECFARTRDADPLSRLLYVDRHTYLSEGVIAKVDRMSMAHSLEVRSPLLDQEITELASLIPARFKLAGGVGKTCLRQLARRRLPAEVVAARKAGFAPPLGSWLRGPLQNLLRERVADPGSFVASVVDPAGVKRMLDEHARGARDWARPLWLLLVLETWARRARPGGLST